jgi:hypothetical protein
MSQGASITVLPAARWGCLLHGGAWWKLASSSLARQALSYLLLVGLQLRRSLERGDRAKLDVSDVFNVLIIRLQCLAIIIGNLLLLAGCCQVDDRHHSAGVCGELL